jgi:hypothetical protein
MSILSDIGDMIANIDLIDKTDSLVRGAIYNGKWLSWKLRTQLYCGMENERYLFKYGVKVFGRELRGVGEHADVGMHVKGKQSRWAEYLLRRRGVQVNETIDPTIAQSASQHTMPPPAWVDQEPKPQAPARRGLLDTLFD